jgi:hypothetical protein
MWLRFAAVVTVWKLMASPQTLALAAPAGRLQFRRGLWPDALGKVPLFRQTRRRA